MIRRHHVEEADDFGAGVDLGVSLFAVVILLLAIFRVGGLDQERLADRIERSQTERREVPPPPARLTR